MEMKTICESNEDIEISKIKDNLTKQEIEEETKKNNYDKTAERERYIHQKLNQVISNNNRDESRTVSNKGSGLSENDTNGDYTERFKEDKSDLIVHTDNLQLEDECNNYDDQEILDDLVYNYDSEDEIEIPNEENFLKSSTSASDDNLESSFGRPRSVHFEDEYWENGQYVSESWNSDDLPSGKTSFSNRNPEENFSQPLRSAKSQSDLSNSERNRRTSELAFSAKGRPQNVKSASKESVREILRRRREEMGDNNDHDSRRRIQSVETPERRRRSRSRDNGLLDPLRREKIDENRLRKAQSMWDCSDSGVDVSMTRTYPGANDHSYRTSYSIKSNNSDGAVIS